MTCRLDDFASEQASKDAAIEARKAALRKQQEEVEAKARAQVEAQAKQTAEREARLAEAKALAEQRRAAAAAAAAEKKSSTQANAGKAAPAGKASKYGTVQTINKQADRIAERETNGEDKPSFFGFY